MSFEMDRRRFLLGSSAAAVAAALGARPVFAADTDLRLIWWGSQERADRTNKVSALYSKENPDTKIQGEFYAWNDYWPKLATETAGGNAPDVIQMDYRYIVEYASRNAIAPLDDYIGKALDLNDFDKDQIEGGKVGGKLYGISLGANSAASLVNLAAFEEAGIDAPSRHSTYDDIMTMGEAFNSKNVRGGMKAFQDGSGVEPLLEHWLRQQGKALYTADGKLAFGTDEMIAWFTLWKKLRDAKVIPSADVQALDTGAEAQTMIVTGKAAVQFQHSNQLVAFQSLMKDPLGMVNYPLIKPDSTGGDYRKPSQFWSVGGSSKALEDAVKYVSFLVNDIDANKILGVERGIPCAAAVRKAIAPGLSKEDQIALNFVSNLGDLLGPLPPPPPPNAGEVETHLLTKSQEVAFDQASPEDAGAAFVKEASDILSRKG